MNIPTTCNDLYMSLNSLSLLAPQNKNALDIQQKNSNGIDKTIDMMANPAQDTTIIKMSFPERLHMLLSDSEKSGFQDVVSWQENGDSFKVHKPNEFINIIPTYFNKPIKYTSFQRQLSIYGFERIRTGWNTGGYTHPYFLREAPKLCKLVKRHCKPTRFEADDHKKVNPNLSLLMDLDSSFKASDNFDDQGSLFPKILSSENLDLSIMDLEPLPLKPKHTHHATSLPDKISSIGSLGSLLALDDYVLDENLSSCLIQEDAVDSRRMINATWDIPAQQNTAPVKSKNAFFPSKLHQLLEDSKDLHFEHIISWSHDGTAFQIHDQKQFTDKIMNIYFDQKKFASFRRQLNLYAFCRRLSRDSRSANEYFHEHFIQINPAMCHKMVRKCKSTKNSQTSA